MKCRAQSLVLARYFRALFCFVFLFSPSLHFTFPISNLKDSLIQKAGRPL